MSSNAKVGVVIWCLVHNFTLRSCTCPIKQTSPKYSILSPFMSKGLILCNGFTGVSKSRYFARSIAIKYSNFSRFYKKKGPFYKKIPFLELLETPNVRCPVGGSIGGCGARAVSRKTPIYFIKWTLFL